MANEEKEAATVVPMEVIESTGGLIRHRPGATALENIREATEVVKALEQFHEVSRRAALKMTKAYNWRDWNGRLRLEEEGARNVMKGFGAYHETPVGEKVTTNSAEGPGYAWEYAAWFVLPMTGTRIYVIGSARSDDDIVATRYGNDESGNRVKQPIPATDVDEQVVKKKALTNLVVNGVIKLFGIGDVRREELAALGIVVGKGGITHTNAAWAMSESQKAVLTKMHATQAELDACKSTGDVTALMNKLNKEKRKAPAATPPASAGPGTETEPPPPPEGDDLDEVKENIREMAGVLNWSKVVLDAKVKSYTDPGGTGLKGLQQAMTELCKAKK